MARITSMIASRPSLSTSSRLTWSSWPSDALLAMITSSSPAIRLRQANAQPCLSPATKLGIAAGRITWR